VARIIQFKISKINRVITVMSNLFNKTIRVLIFSDVVLISSFGFIVPIFPIFLTESIVGGNVKVAGFAAAVYWIVHSLVLIPIGQFLDKRKGEIDDLLFIVFGNFLAAAAVIGYLFASLPWHIYSLEAIYALGMAMNIPAYTAIFSRHLDKGKEAVSWGTRGALVGVGTGIAGALGGAIAFDIGFEVLFVGVAGFIVLSSVLPLLLLGELAREKIKK